MALLSAHCGVEASHVFCQGAVRNVSDRPLADLWARITLLDDEGLPERAGIGQVDLNPLRPGAVSTWRVVVTRFNVPFTAFQTEFTPHANGPILRMRDERPEALDVVAR